MNDSPHLTLDVLRKAVKELRDKDPLLNRGIKLDWVCVVNPAIVGNIKELAKEFHNPNSVVVIVDDLQAVMGRRVFVIEQAPMNPQYMPEETMRQMYAEHFRWVAEWLAEQEKRKGENAL